MEKATEATLFFFKETQLTHNLAPEGEGRKKLAGRKKVYEGEIKSRFTLPGGTSIICRNPNAFTIGEEKGVKGGGGRMCAWK